MSFIDGSPGPFGPQLRQARLVAMMTLEELADRSGVSVRAISDLERGKTRHPYPRTVRMLTAAIGLPGSAGAEPTAPGHPAARSTTTGQPPRTAEPGQPAPAQLPAGARHFVGRAAELATLTGLLDRAGEELPRTVVISAVGGTAGVGKTALAVHWAHQVADRFPDGQLYVNLRGYEPEQPMTAAEALARFLRALGSAGPDIPADADERAARYRSLLAGRRMLVILDNAGSVDQVRPLLPGAPACAVVVTSRDSLAGLVARDGARRVSLDLLPLRDAVGLLRALIGRRVDADPPAAEALARQCAQLPLALRVAAELATARPRVPLAGLAGELADQQRRLDLLDAGGDSRTAVRTVFSWSYQHLDPTVGRAFRLTGLHPGPDLDSYAAAALTGAAIGEASRQLEQLARGHLVHATGAGRYGMHDLLCAYALEQAISQDSEPDRRAALTRLFDHYLHASGIAMDTLFPAERHRRPAIPAAATVAPPLTVPAAARMWLDAERATLAAVAAYTATHGWPGHTTRLAATLFRYLDAGGHYHEAITIHEHARRAAQRSGDRIAEALALTSLGVADWRLGRYDQATGHHLQALAICRQTGDQTGQARALSNAGLAELQQGRDQRAIARFTDALTLCQQAGDLLGQARALSNLGLAESQQGYHHQATSHLQQALALYQQTGDRLGEAHALNGLGDVDLRQGRYQQATGHLRRGLALCLQTGERNCEASILTCLGVIDLRQDRYQQATGHHRQALSLFRETGDRAGQAEALNGLGEVLLATGQPGQARAQHTRALRMARQIAEQAQQARAHDGLAGAYLSVGDHGQAHHHRQQALALHSNFGGRRARR